MDPLYVALSRYRIRQYTKSADACGIILDQNPQDQAAWCLKLMCLSAELYVDEVDQEDEGIAESFLDDNNVAQVARPGTSLNRPTTGQSGIPSQSVRPRTTTGRPLTGVVRPGSRGTTGGLERALRTPRTASTARPATSATGRAVRLGTASMLTSPGGPFLNLSRLNLSKYSADPCLSKPLFEYIFYHDGDIRNALQLAALATQHAQFKDPYWKLQLGKCYYRLSLFRDAEKQFKSAVNQNPTIETYLYVAKVNARLDQPVAAIDTYKQGLDKFPANVSLLIGLARMLEGVNRLEEAQQCYKSVLKEDSSNVEAMSCVATHYFYTDQPEVALRFFRRLLQMGVHNSELYCNIGLCCFYSQQFDLALGCVQRALNMSNDHNSADVWYNMGHIALGAGDTNMGYQCFRLALAAQNDHPEACCNIAVLEMRKGNHDKARSLLETAMSLGHYTFEPFFNYALLSYETGELQSAYNALKKSIDLFPDHPDSIELMKRMQLMLSEI